MQYAIYRHKKLKTIGQIASSAKHMARISDVSHAARQNKNRNIILAGSENPMDDVAKLLEKVEKIRKNNVLAIEVLLTASPKFFQNATDEQLAEWIHSSYTWLASTYGVKNIAHAQVHMDERTPHITGFVVPIDENHRLNAKKWCGGREKCSAMQSSYAQAVSHLGLHRGIHNSKAKHNRVRRHYAQIEAASAGSELSHEAAKIYASELQRRIAMQVTAKNYEIIANEYMGKIQMIADYAKIVDGKAVIFDPKCVQLLEALHRDQTSIEEKEEIKEKEMQTMKTEMQVKAKQRM